MPLIALLPVLLISLKTLPAPVPSPSNPTGGDKLPAWTWGAVQGASSYDLPLDQPEKLERWKSEPGMLGLRYIFNEPRHAAWLEGDELEWLWTGAERLGAMKP